MSNYKRFIMYLFQYENGSKEANCGSAKVECRQNKGRMQLHINEEIRREDVCRVYFFVKGEQELPCIFLGELAAETVDAGFVFDCKRTGGSIYGFEEIRGLVIPLAAGKLIASQWDDEAYDWGELKYEPSSNEISSEEAGKLEEMVYTANGKADSEERRKTGNIITEAEEQRERFAENNIQATEQGTVINETRDYEEKQPNESDLKMQSMYGAAAHRMVYPLLDDDAPTDRQRGGRNSGSISTAAQNLGSIYPRVYPFAGDKSVWGMQIQMKDLKALPPDYQMIGTNSFLLHGFFTYGTLLLGYMEDTQQWFLGVPGIYQNQERVMAALFGFSEFRTCQECVQKTGEFGYWYRFLF